MFICNICHRELKTKDTLKTHYKSLMHRYNIKHIEYVKNNYAYSCKTCGYNTNIKLSYTSHLKSLRHFEKIANIF